MRTVRALRDRLLAFVDPIEPHRDEVDVTGPVEHLRRAVAASRRSEAASPRVYSELRLLLNQLEAGRISEEPARTLARRSAPPPRSLRARLGREARAVIRRIRTASRR
jgi:hypothetical protein